MTFLKLFTVSSSTDRVLFSSESVLLRPGTCLLLHLNPRTDHWLLGISLGLLETAVKDKIGGPSEFSDGSREDAE